MPIGYSNGMLTLDYLGTELKIPAEIIEMGGGARTTLGIDIKDVINAKYDAEYVDAVKKGTMTKEQAMKALEEVGRKDSSAYAELAALESTPASSMTDEQKAQRIQEIDADLLGLALSGLQNSDEYNKLIQERDSLIPKDDSNEPAPFSISPTEAVERINMQTAESNLARMLNMRTPQNPNGVFSIQDVRNILTNVKNNGITWGAFFNNVVYLSEKAGVGTEYHEAFHAVFRTLLSPTQINAYYAAARKQYGNPTKSRYYKS